MKEGTSRRLSPEARKAEILRAAMRVLATCGLNGFSLEAVAREAGVAPTLPRYYFGSTEGLLLAATNNELRKVESALLNTEQGLSLSARFNRYLDLINQAPWGHEVWMRAPDLHADLDAIVRTARLRMVESMYRRPWKELTQLEQMDGRGKIGYIEAVVSYWIEQGMGDREVVIEALLCVAQLSDRKKPNDSLTPETTS